MKKLLSLIGLLLGSLLYAQAPQFIHYQAVIRDANGAVISNQTIALKLEITQGTNTYTEIQSITTNNLGLVNLNVGTTPAPNSIPFADIDWADGNTSLITWYDPTNTQSNWQYISSSNLASVPYALYAENVFSGNFNDLTNVPTIDTSETNEIQQLFIIGDTLMLTSGGSVVLPFDPDMDSTNEIQSLTIVGDTIALSSGGSVVLPFDPDMDSTNEIQSLTIVGDTIALSSGGSVVLPFDPDMDSTNELQSLIYQNDTLSLSSGNSVILPLSSKAESLNDLNDAISSQSKLALGIGALNSNSTSTDNVAVGMSSLTSVTSGESNSSFGSNSMAGNLTGNHNTAAGYYAMRYNTAGSRNTGVGSRVLMFATGSDNSAIGEQALYSSSGNGNIALGNGAQYNTTSGSLNNAIGYNTLSQNNTGSGNTAVGHTAMIGNTSGSNNVALGYNANVGDTALSNAIAIGYNSVVNASNSIQLGNTSITKVITSGEYVGAGFNITDSSSGTGNVIAELNSNSKGFLLPRMTQVERDSIANPPVGLMIYCTDCITGGELESFNGSVWRSSSFTSVNTIPALNTNAPDFVNADSAQLSFVVINSGGLTLLSAGIELALDGSFSTSIAMFSSTSPTTGTNLANFGSLLPNTTYYYRGFASNALGVAYGNIGSFTTLPNSSGVTPPAIIISPTSTANHISINIGASFISPGTNPILFKGFCYSLTASPDFSYFTSEGANSTNYSSLIGNLLSDTTYYIKAYAATALDTFYSNITSVNTTVASQFYVGQLHNGGVIFYLDSTGSHGLIAAPSDLGRYQWGCQGNLIDSTQSGLGYGEYNSTRISANCFSTSPTAASACLNAVINGFGDWYLPSFNELQLLKTNLYDNGYTQYFDTDEGSYWSSTEISATQAMQLEFYFGGWYVGTPPGKTNQRKVHPIRSF